MDIVAVTLDRPCLSVIGVIVREVMLPCEDVDEPLTNVSGSVGFAGDKLVREIVESRLV